MGKKKLDKPEIKIPDGMLGVLIQNGKLISWPHGEPVDPTKIKDDQKIAFITSNHDIITNEEFPLNLEEIIANERRKGLSNTVFNSMRNFTRR